MGVVVYCSSDTWSTSGNPYALQNLIQLPIELAFQRLNVGKGESRSRLPCRHIRRVDLTRNLIKGTSM